MKSVVLAVAAAFVTGCASMAPMERPPINLAEYEALPKEGTGVVTGQVFLRTMVGEVRYGAGSEVSLNPVTSYSTFWYENGHKPNRRLAPPDTRQDAYIITTQADGHGNFRFENVPPGDYYLTSGVFWQVPLGAFSSTQSGGWVSERITVENDKETKQMLTR